MTSDRPYRQALSLEVALAEFRRLRGGQWMPQVVDALEALLADPIQHHALARTRLSLVPVPVPATATA
jgi:HD-GYP domain-containing protein (c-di-GMP phosphodiesterase class II)